MGGEGIEMDAERADAVHCVPFRGRSRRVIRALVSALVLVAGVALLQACGGSDNETAGAGTTASSTATTQTSAGAPQPDPGYNGPDREQMQLLPAATKKAGQSFKVGLMQANKAVGILNGIENGVTAQVEDLGGTLVVKDAQGDFGRQVSQLDQLVTSGVDAIVVHPLNSASLAAGIKTARKQGIPVAVVDSTPGDPLKEAVTNIDAARDYSTYATMKELASQLPKGAAFTIMGLGLPVPILQYQAKRQEYWGKQFGMNFLGQVGAKGVTPSDYATAGGSLLSRYPKAQAVVTLADEAAVAMANQARVNGKTDLAVATSNGGDPLSEPLLKAGKLAAVYRIPWELMGQQATIAAYSALTDPDKSLPEVIQVPGQVITKKNVQDAKFVGE
jgi:ribose transport system substrate-binding protein